VLTGKELDRLTENELRDVVKTHSIFSRVFPEQKLKLVEALKKNGEIVAMTGDGVNDAPALRGAQIGIAMGRRGTDVAREAANLVLLDDDFGSIVDAIRMGRRIYSNIQAAFVYLIAVHIPIAGMSVLPVFLNLPLVLLPIHIAFLHLIIEPVCSIAFEAESPQSNLMRQLPRRRDARLLTFGVVFPAIVQGMSILISLVVIYILSLYRGQGEEDARALSFTSLVVANVVLIVTSREVAPRRILRNHWTVGIGVGSLVLLLLVIYEPTLRGAFRFSVLHALDWVICLGVGGLSVVWLSVLRRMVKIF
jgi:Ca2+-transporting ATPase